MMRVLYKGDIIYRLSDVVALGKLIMYNTFSSIFVIAASDAVPVVAGTVTSRHALDRRAMVTFAASKVYSSLNIYSLSSLLSLSSCYHHRDYVFVIINMLLL